MGSAPSNKLKKRVITWASIVILLVLAFLGILKLGLYFSSDILYQLVKRETNGYYQLSFEEIEIDLWNRAIKLKKVKLKPDSTKDFHAKGLNNLYDLELTGITIDLESISSIYTDRKLFIENVRIIDPQIHIIREKNAPAESFSLQTGNLYKEISDYLKVLRIDLLSTENAVFGHSPSELGLDNIDFSVKNFLIDSTSSHVKKFYSESLELEIHHQSFKLADSIHQLSFDRFLLSTTDSVLTFENLVLKPISSFHGSFDDMEDKIVYDITIPKLKLKGVDYFSAYRNNHLEMEELSLIDSHIFLEEQTHTEQNQPKIKGNSLLKQLINIFDVIKIGKMRFINTNLNLKTNEDYNHNYQHVQSERADIVLYNFFLDSTNYDFDRGKKYFDDVDIIIKDYSSYLPDSIHTINFELLQLSSFDSSLIFNNFNISNNGKGSPSDMYLNIDLPMIRLKGLNYLDILIDQKLLIKEMRLEKPIVNFENRQGKVGQKDFSPKRIYELLAEHFKVVGIKNLRLNQGEFSINKQFQLGKTDLLISNFKLHNQSSSWYEVLGGVELNIQDVALGTESVHLKASDFTLDRIARRMVLNGLTIDYLDDNKSIFGHLPKLTVSGIDLDSLATGNYLAFDSIKLNSPNLKFDILKPNKTSTDDNLLGSKFIEIVNGKVNGKTTNATSFSASNVNAKLTLGSENNIQHGEAKQISITLPKSPHQLNVSELRFSKTQTLQVNNIKWQSIKDSVLHRVEFNGNIPSLTLHGLNQKVLWEQNRLEGDSLLIEKPLLNLNLNDVAKEGVNSNNFEVAFQKIIFEKANVTFVDKSQTTIEQMVTPDLSLILEAFEFPQKSVLSQDHLLYADNVTLNVKNFRPFVASGDSLVIRQLLYNKKDALLFIDTLTYDQATSATSALLPGIELVGLDLHSLLVQKQLKLDSIQMNAAQISIDRVAPKKDQKRQVNAFPKSVDIRYFSSMKTEFVFKDSLNPTGYALHEGAFEVREFYAEDDIDWKRFFNYAQFASMSAKNLALPLGDGYQLSIDHYDLQHPKNSLTLDYITLTSDLTATEYSNNLTFQKDWFDVKVDGITFNGLDFKGAFSAGEYHTEKVALEGLDALVYRDKSVEFQTGIVKDLPQSILRKIDTWVYVDTLQLKGDITYQEKPANKDEVAEISFNNLDAFLFNITTVDSMAHKPMHLSAKGKLVDTAHFQINAMFDMFDRHEPKDKFTFSGYIDQMPLGALNKLLRPVAGINIKDGCAERISFNIEANDEFARGEMNFRYNNLRVQILNPETNDLKGLNQGIKTFFANTFVVKRRNPNFIFLRPGNIFLQRDHNRAIFHYWGKALLSGAVSSVGIHKSRKAEKKFGKKEEENKK